MEPVQHAYQTTYDARTEHVPIQINTAFLREAHGILKIVELVLTIIIFICVSCHWVFSTSSGVWVNFTAALSLICSTFFFVIYLFNLLHRLPGPWVLIDFVTQLTLCLLMTISMIVSAVCGTYTGAAVASAVFCAFLAIAYLVECLLRFSVYRQNGQLFVTVRGTTRIIRNGASFDAAPQEPTFPANDPHPTDSYGLP